MYYIYRFLHFWSKNRLHPFTNRQKNFKDCPGRVASLRSFGFSFIFSLQSSSLDHSATAAPISNFFNSLTIETIVESNGNSVYFNQCVQRTAAYSLRSKIIWCIFFEKIEIYPLITFFVTMMLT